MTGVAIVPCCPTRSGAEQRARTTAVGIMAAERNGISGALADGKHAGRRATWATPRPGVRGTPIPSTWQARNMRSRAFNVRQRVVVVIGIGAALFFFGSWLTTRGQGGSGWVAYAPLSNTINASDLPGPGLHPWVRLLIWLALIAIWVVAGVVLLRTRSPEDSSGPAD